MPHGVFEARFTGKTPCWICGNIISKNQWAKFDFTTGEKRVIHYDCVPQETTAVGKLPDWTPTDEQHTITDTAVEYIKKYEDQHVDDDLFGTTSDQMSPLSLVIKALAGTGKTSVLELTMNTLTLAKIFPNDKPFAQYLVFNADNANEATTRISPLIATSSTIHRFGFQLVKQHFGRDTRKTAVPKKIQYMYNEIFTDIRALEYGSKEYKKESFRMAMMWKLIDKMKNLCIRPGDEFFAKASQVAAFFDVSLPHDDTTFLDDCNRLFLESVNDTSQCDYSDMLYFLWYYDIEITLPSWIRLVCIDEYQDQNPLRVWITKQLADLMVHMIIVGDTFQAIMGFTGALTDAMDEGAKAIDRGKLISLPLTVNLRTKNLHVIEYVRDRYIPQLKAHPDAFHGLPVQQHGPEEFNAIIRSLQPGDAVLSRTNAPTVKIYFELLRLGKGAIIKGREVAENITGLFKNLAATYDCQTAWEFISASHTWEEKYCSGSSTNRIFVQDQAETIRAICEGVQPGMTLNEILDTVNGMFSDLVNGTRHAIITLSSAHKAKGLEWNRVFTLTNVDQREMFPHPMVTTPELVTQEWNLLYAVACLRAINELHFIQMDGAL